MNYCGGEILTCTPENFKKFLFNIELGTSEIEDAKTKHNSICEKLHNHYYETTYTGATKLIVGSCGKKTAINPLNDVDVIFKLPFSEKKRYDDYKNNGQSQLLQDVKNILLKSYPRTSIRGDGPVVAVDFETCKIELIPSVKMSSSYYVPITSDGGNWERTEPIIEKESVQTSNSRSNGNTINLIKMIKTWKNYCNVPIKSLAIELIAIDFLEIWEYYDKSNVYYDWMVRDFFETLVNSAGKSHDIPGTYNTLDYGDQWVSKAETAHERAEKAIEYESKKLNYCARDEWKKIFGNKFG